MSDKKYDYCIKTQEESAIWMVREKTKSRVQFETWDEYEEAGKPPFRIVTPEELEGYEVVSYFRG